MKNNNRTLSRGQKIKFPAMALGLSLAIAAPAFADFSGSKTVLNGQTWNEDGDIAKTANTDITVNVGGTMTGGEFLAADEWGYTFDLNIYGTAEIEQFKIYGDGASTITVGNGTDAATLTIGEGFLGKHGDSTITINSGSSMVIDATAYGWAGEFEIRTDFTSSIDLVGTGTLKLLSTADLFNDGLVTGNGGTTAVTTASVGDYTVYSTTAVPEPTSMSLLALGGLALLRRRRRA